jgi:phenylpropionate dioxygenase-like ring-hydroxylating dioxygenase large terminal subunit
MIKLNSKHPKIFTHVDSFKKNNYFGSSGYVINKKLQLFPNRCPHRGNKIIFPGTVKNQFQCGLHGWEWNDFGVGINNNVNFNPKQAVKGSSGLIFLDWEEPTSARWVRNLKNDDLDYSYSIKKEGIGDWRWQMEMHVDLLHVEYIHPRLNKYVDCNELETERGYDWIAQHHKHGWWLFVYPFTHIEWEPGCLYISEMSPKEGNQGYDVYIHYLYNHNITEKQKHNFSIMVDETFDEDIRAVNALSATSKYRTPSNAIHPLEQDIIHFYNWLKDNVE